MHVPKFLCLKFLALQLAGLYVNMKSNCQVFLKLILQKFLLTTAHYYLELNIIKITLKEMPVTQLSQLFVKCY